MFMEWEDIEFVLNKHGITLSDPTTDDNVFYRHIRFFSPEGEEVYEDFEFDGTPETFVNDFNELAESFDADEHAETYVSQRGTRGIPESIRDLINDADWIKNTLLAVAEELSDIEEGKESVLQCYEITIGNYDENNLPDITDRVYCVATGRPTRETARDFCTEMLDETFETVFGIKEVNAEEYLENGDNVLFFSL